MKPEYPITFFTICLNGGQWLYHHLPMMQRLNVPWRWVICEGYAKPVNDTAWCKPLRPMVSDDGSHEYLVSISDHPRVTHLFKTEWEGKREMCQAAVDTIKEPCLLIELDADEQYESWQILFALEFFKANPQMNTGQVYAQFFVGNNIVVTSKDTWGCRATEWKRMWRFTPGMKWKSHEPPVWENFTEKIITRDQMASKGVVMMHHAYETEASIKFREVYYGYGGLLAGWRRLQAHTQFPITNLAEFMPHVGPGVTCDLLHK